jgi:protein-S-isoprenylcysteine O-methyltransferase Ste14
MSKSHLPWWRGERGEWYAALQLALILLVVFGPSTLAGFPKWPLFTIFFRIAGASLMVGGVVLGAAALRHLRLSITTSGALKAEGALVTNGPYRFVRHPLYTAQILLTFGWSLALGGWLTAVYAIALSVVLNFKSLKEERRLLQRFPEYRDYQSRTRKFVPLIY